MNDVPDGQITLDDYLETRKKIEYGGCGNCVCRSCLYWWSERCPHGDCYDDLRALENPYDKAHPDKPPRTWWSDWNKPGEQAYWCRGGNNYPVYYCPNFVKYKGQQVKHCLYAAVGIFQDGYISCSLVDTVGCEQCYERWLAEMEKKEQCE